MSIPEWVARQSNPLVGVVRAEDGRIVGTDDFEAILSADTFNLPAMQGMRALYNPGWTVDAMRSGGAQRTVGTHSVNSVAIFLKASLDLRATEKLLRALLPTKEKGAAQHQQLGGTIYRIKALALLDDAQSERGVYQIHYVRQSKHVSLTKSKVADAAGAHQPSFIFVGIDLDEASLKEWLGSCRAKPAAPLPERTRRSVTKAETAKILKAHEGEPLPEGKRKNKSHIRTGPLCCCCCKRGRGHPPFPLPPAGWAPVLFCACVFTMRDF